MTVQKSDLNGVVVFRNIDMTSIAWSVDVNNMSTTEIHRDFILCKPENVAAQGGLKPDVTSLPAEITIYVRRRGFAEQLEYLFRGP